MKNKEKNQTEDKGFKIAPLAVSALFFSFALAAVLFLGSGYFTYLDVWATEAAQQTPPKITPGKPAGFDPAEIKYRRFFISSPGAKRVALIADFNGYGEREVLLKPYKRGYFEISVALAAGDYRYVFNVDGKDVLDPLNKDVVETDGRKFNVKTVR